MKKSTSRATTSRSTSTKKKTAEPTGFGLALVEVPASSPDCLAKTERTSEGATRYYVKCGGNSSVPFGPCNPYGLGFRPGDLAKNDLTGRPFYQWRECTPAGFDIYKRFLETSNQALVNQFIRSEGL
jgi:hypothetical protein